MKESCDKKTTTKKAKKKNNTQRKKDRENEKEQKIKKKSQYETYATNQRLTTTFEKRNQRKTFKNKVESRIRKGKSLNADSRAKAKF